MSTPPTPQEIADLREALAAAKNLMVFVKIDPVSGEMVGVGTNPIIARAIYAAFKLAPGLLVALDAANQSLDIWNQGEKRNAARLASLETALLAADQLRKAPLVGGLQVETAAYAYDVARAKTKDGANG